MLSDNKTGLLTWGSRFVGSYFIEKYSLKYEIKIFSFLKNNVNTLDCTDVDVVFHLSASNGWS